MALKTVCIDPLSTRCFTSHREQYQYDGFFVHDLAYYLSVMDLDMNLTYFYRCDARPGIIIANNINMMVFSYDLAYYLTVMDLDMNLTYFY